MIYINGRFLTQNMTGVQRFAEEISLQIEYMRDDVILLVPDVKAIKKQSLLKRFNIEEVPGLNGHLWEQITLPLYLLRRKSPLLINLGNTAPVFYSHQVVTHHDITYLKYPKSFPFSFRLLYRIISPLMIRNSKQVVTVSQFSRSEISSQYRCQEEKIKIIYNAVSDLFEPTKEVTSEPDKERYLLAVSSTNYHKNFHGLIDAFSDANLDIDLKIIGDSADVFSTLDLKRNHPRIHFVGRVNDDELVKLYQHATAFVFPSFYEGFGIPPLEAQACGCPVISSNTASMPEVLGESVLYFNPESKREIINALSLIVSDVELRAQLVEKGFKNKERFSWGESASKLNDIIRNFSF
ncbi:glycosyltransferase family 4 protein [Rahnella inusitata]|uniref:glycosyltransferase family 4 protein n=1 Tax=Rahnella inusitata TaxID=58169 RepID=UPI001BC85118|nr:glycosyltransferase family 1 protein [Rahnella inusitata]QUT14841.1 glycosyltransferase family 4 protein [Rahnella inusitata]